MQDISMRWSLHTKGSSLLWLEWRGQEQAWSRFNFIHEFYLLTYIFTTAIFWGSDSGRHQMSSLGFDSTTSTIIPPLVISTVVQIVNQPIVRASITIQDPAAPYAGTMEAIRAIAATKGSSFSTSILTIRFFTTPQIRCLEVVARYFCWDNENSSKILHRHYG